MNTTDTNRHHRPTGPHPHRRRALALAIAGTALASASLVSAPPAGAAPPLLPVWLTGSDNSIGGCNVTPATPVFSHINDQGHPEYDFNFTYNCALGRRVNVTKHRPQYLQHDGTWKDFRFYHWYAVRTGDAPWTYTQKHDLPVHSLVAAPQITIRHRLTFEVCTLDEKPFCSPESDWRVSPRATVAT
jgi:hypothetical protein